MKYCRIILASAVLTACLGISARERGMANSEAVFIEKGIFSAGLSLGVDSWQADGNEGYDLLGLIEGLDGYVRRGDVSAAGAWFVKDNLSVGLRMGYTDARVSMDSISLGDIEIPGRNVMNQNVSGSLTCRGYLPLFDGRILAMFVEGRLTGSAGYAKSYETTERGKEGSYSDIWSASAGLYPGLSVFATHNISFEVSLPLLEGGMRWQEQEATASGEGTLKRSYINFKPNLLGLRMGMVFHF